MKNITPCLMKVDGIKHFAENDMPGYIYFLAKDEDVVYVGQTVNIRSRLRDHKKSKQYDKVCFIEVPQNRLIEIESAFIRAMKPSLNGVGISRPIESDKKILSEFGAEYLLAAKDCWRLEPIEPGSFGAVKVIEGPFAGKSGFYDDDLWRENDDDCYCVVEDDCICDELAIVYMERWTDGYNLIPHAYLRHLSDGSESRRVGKKLLSCFENIDGRIIAFGFGNNPAFYDVECVIPVPGEKQLAQQLSFPEVQHD